MATGAEVIKKYAKASEQTRVNMYNTGETRGTSQSYNMNYQKLGHDLMSIDELAVMDGSKCIVQIRGVRPFLSNKYDLTLHPKYPLTADADKRNLFDIEKFLNHNLILKSDDKYEVIEIKENKRLQKELKREKERLHVQFVAEEKDGYDV